MKKLFLKQTGKTIPSPEEESNIECKANQLFKDFLKMLLLTFILFPREKQNHLQETKQQLTQLTFLRENPYISLQRNTGKLDLKHLPKCKVWRSSFLTEYF